MHDQHGKDGPRAADEKPVLAAAAVGDQDIGDGPGIGGVGEGFRVEQGEAIIAVILEIGPLLREQLHRVDDDDAAHGGPMPRRNHGNLRLNVDDE